MSDWLLLLAFLAVVVGIPAGIGWAAGRRLGGKRGRLVALALPVVGWTVRLVYELSLPGPDDFGPTPAIDLNQWIIGCVVTGSISVLAAMAFDRDRMNVGAQSGA